MLNLQGKVSPVVWQMKDGFLSKCIQIWHSGLVQILLIFILKERCVEKEMLFLGWDYSGILSPKVVAEVLY